MTITNKKKLLIISLIVIFTLVIISIILLNNTRKNSNKNDIGNLPDILTESEKALWKDNPVDDSMVFIDLNTDISMNEGDNEAYLRLINPPYSAYAIKIQIKLLNYEDDNSDDTTIYESDIIAPGTIKEYIQFNRKFKSGVYDAIVDYTFYDIEGENILGEHQVKITINVN